MWIYTKQKYQWQTFVMRQIIEKCYEYNTDLYILFNEIWRAFDSKDIISIISRCRILWHISKIIKLIKMTLNDNISKVLVAITGSRPFSVSTGVRQGDAMSEALLNTAWNSFVRNYRKMKPYKSTQMCVYAWWHCCDCQEHHSFNRNIKGTGNWRQKNGIEADKKKNKNHTYPNARWL